MDSLMRRQAITVFLLAAIVGCAFWLRFNTFWLPHWKGDQNQYIALAMKLDEQGFNGYNLREVRLGSYVVSEDPPIQLAFCKRSEPGEKGDLIRLLNMVGQFHYDQPFHHRPPLFAGILMASHHLFGDGKKIYGVCSSNLGEKVDSIKPAIVFKTQFWAVIVPLFFNLALIVMTFLLGARFFNERVALWGAFLMAVNPVSLVMAHLLLVEDTLAFFVTLSVFLTLEFLPKKNYFGVFAAGAAAGLAILTKQTGGVLLGVVFLYAWLNEREKHKKYSGFLSKGFLIYTAGAVLVSGFWFWKVWQNFGNPMYLPSTFAAVKTDMTGWIRQVSHRPAPLFFFSLGVLYLSPVFTFAFSSFRNFYRRVAGTSPGAGAADAKTLLWLWILASYFFLVEPWHLLVLIANQEHRFFYTAYPAIALLAASGLDRFRQTAGKKIGNTFWADAAIALLLLANACWGVRQAMPVVMNNQLLF